MKRRWIVNCIAPSTSHPYWRTSVKDTWAPVRPRVVPGCLLRHDTRPEALASARAFLAAFHGREGGASYEGPSVGWARAAS
jgi:hypothetical protein